MENEETKKCDKLITMLEEIRSYKALSQQRDEYLKRFKLLEEDLKKMEQTPIIKAALQIAEGKELVVKNAGPKKVKVVDTRDPKKWTIWFYMGHYWMDAGTFHRFLTQDEGARSEVPGTMMFLGQLFNRQSLVPTDFDTVIPYKYKRSLYNVKWLKKLVDADHLYEAYKGNFEYILNHIEDTDCPCPEMAGLFEPEYTGHVTSQAKLKCEVDEVLNNCRFLRKGKKNHLVLLRKARRLLLPVPIEDLKKSELLESFSMRETSMETFLYTVQKYNKRFPADSIQINLYGITTLDKLKLEAEKVCS